MKRLILINGPMGAGKTTVTPLLAQKLSPAVWLDGDWCWKMEPFTVTEENKAVVLENIHTLLGNFLRRGSWETVLFCWVMDHPEILRQVLQPLRDEKIPLWLFTLTCTPEVLKARLEKDVKAGIRTPDIIPRSLERLPLYRDMDTVQVDVTRRTPEQAAQVMADLVLGDRERRCWP